MRNETGCFRDVSPGLCPNGPGCQVFLAMELMKGLPEEDTFCVFMKAGDISRTCQKGSPCLIQGYHPTECSGRTMTIYVGGLMACPGGGTAEKDSLPKALYSVSPIWKTTVWWGGRHYQISNYKSQFHAYQPPPTTAYLKFWIKNYIFFKLLVVRKVREFLGNLKLT